jgi:RNA polymerase sigma factor (sigma-70 family)
MQRLTDEQRSLVEANLDVARKIARIASAKYKGRFSYDEAFSSAAFGLVSKASKHDASISKFSTSANARANGQILDDLRKKYHWMSGDRKKGNKATPHQFGDDLRGSGSEYRIPAKQEQSEIESLDAVDAMTKCLTDEEKQVIVRHIVGEEKVSDIAESMGLEWYRVQYLKQSALAKMRKEHGKQPTQQ